MDEQVVSLIVACSLMAIDVVVGFVGSLIDGSFKSSIMREGLVHKAMELVIIGVAYLIQWAGAYGVAIIAPAAVDSAMDVYASLPIGEAVTLYVAIMELGSVLELVVKYNPHLSDAPVLKWFAHKSDK